MKKFKSIFAIALLLVIVLGATQALNAGSNSCWPNPELNPFLNKVCNGNLPAQAWFDACCGGNPCTLPCGI